MTNWDNDELSTLTAEHSHRLAPRLLTLHHLFRECRTLLEKSSKRQPVEVLRSYKNYPEIIDHTLMNTILVDAKLRKSNK